MTDTEMWTALSAGCCSRHTVIEKGCATCEPQLAALDQAQVLVARLRAEVERLKSLAANVMHADGSLGRADIVYSRGFRAGRAEGQAECERLGGCMLGLSAEVERLRHVAKAAERLRNALERVGWPRGMNDVVAAYDAARGQR